MGSTITPCFYSQIHYPKVTYQNPSPSLSVHRTVQRLSQFSFRRRTKLQIGSCFSLSPLYETTIRRSSRISNFLTAFLSEKVLVSLLGSFIFLGSYGFNVRPSLALPPLVSDFNGPGGKKVAQMEKSEDEEMYEKILEKEPRNLEALKVVVHEKMRRGKNKEAVKYVERLIALEPQEVEWRLLEALCYEVMGQFGTAKRLFKEILKERPLLLRALHGLALAMHKNHEGLAVFEMLNEALDVAIRDKRVTEERNIKILIAQMHVVNGELEEGLQKFQDLVDENPRDFRPYLCQGIIYSLLDRKEEAAERFAIYQSLVPEEFPQRGFLDDVVLEAKSKSRERLQKEFQAEFSYRGRILLQSLKGWFCSKM